MVSRIPFLVCFSRGCTTRTSRQTDCRSNTTRLISDAQTQILEILRTTRMGNRYGQVTSTKAAPLAILTWMLSARAARLLGGKIRPHRVSTLKLQVSRTKILVCPFIVALTRTSSLVSSTRSSESFHNSRIKSLTRPVYKTISI